MACWWFGQSWLGRWVGGWTDRRTNGWVLWAGWQMVASWVRIRPSVVRYTLCSGSCSPAGKVRACPWTMSLHEEARVCKLSSVKERPAVVLVLGKWVLFPMGRFLEKDILQ